MVIEVTNTCIIPQKSLQAQQYLASGYNADEDNGCTNPPSNTASRGACLLKPRKAAAPFHILDSRDPSIELTAAPALIIQAPDKPAWDQNNTSFTTRGTKPLTRHKQTRIMGPSSSLTNHVHVIITTAPLSSV
jgi:hypothetical protein